jgi:integrase
VGAARGRAEHGNGSVCSPSWASSGPLSDLFSRYKREVTPLPLRGRARAPDALDHEIRTLERFDRLFGRMQQDELTARQLYEYIDRRLDERKEFAGKKKPSPSAAKHDVRFLAKVLRKGIKWGAGEKNVALDIELDPDPKNERDVTPDEYAAVYALANVRIQIAMELASNIGQRRGDLLAIRVGEHLTEEGVLVRQGKTGALVLVEWTPGLRATIDRALALPPDIPKEHVLRRRDGRPYTRQGFGGMWQRLMSKAVRTGAIKARFKFHDLRAMAATAKADQETDEAAQELLGHADVRTTRRNYIRRRKPRRATPVR